MKWLPPLLLGAAALLLALSYQRLPARWIVHWGPSGRPDGWATKTPLEVFGPLLVGVAAWLVFEWSARAAQKKMPRPLPSMSLSLRLVATSVALVIGAAALWLPLDQPARRARASSRTYV